MKRQLCAKVKTLRFESLETRELLSVNPLGAFPESVPQDSVLQGSADGSYAGAIALALGEPETPSTVVTTDADAVDAYDGEISLREALGDYSSAGDTITFASSMKGKTITLDAELGQLWVDKNVTIDASDLYDASTETPGVTLSGDDATIIMVVDGGVTTTVKGLAFTRGRSVNSGGAIVNLGALTIQDCVFTGNKTTDWTIEPTTPPELGGVVLVGREEGCRGGSLIANHCVFSGNDSQSAITFLTDEDSTIRDCQILGNVTDLYGQSSGYGETGVYLWSGAAQINVEDSVIANCDYGVHLYSSVGSVVVSNSELSSNKRGIYLCPVTGFPVSGQASCSVVVENSVLTGNVLGVYRTDSSYIGDVSLNVSISNCDLSSNGYAIDVYSCGDNESYVVENSVLTGNSVGVIHESGAGSFNVSNCEFSRNVRGVHLGLSASLSISDSKILDGHTGVVSGGRLDATNVVVANNEGVSNAAGIILGAGEMTLRNSTVTNNTVEYNGAGGIYVADAAVLNAYNSIIAGNRAYGTQYDDNYVDVYKESGAKTNAWDVISGYTEWDAGVNQLTYDASQPLFTDAAHGDYTLAENSQAINRGDNSYVTAQADIAGKTRIIDETVDLGACEYGRDPFAITVSSYDSSARQAILEWGAVPEVATYRLQISKDGGETWLNYRTGLTTPTATVNGLYVGKSYAFRVYGTSVSGAAVSTTCVERTFAPISLTSASETYRSGETIVVTQAGASNASSTIKWYSVTKDGDVEIVSARNSLTYTPTTDEVAIKVVAIGTGDSEDCSPSLNFIQSKSITVSSYDSSTRQAVLNWDAIPDASSYKLKISKDGGETWTNYKTGLATTTATVNGLYAGKSYAFRVYGVNNLGRTVISPYAEQVFAPVSLSSSFESYSVGKPVVVTETSAANASSTIKWYYVTENGDVEITDARDSLTYTPTSSDYDIKVVATGTGDSIGSSSSLTFTPSQNAIPSIAVSSYNLSTRQAVLEWDAISGAKQYRLQISKDGGLTWATYKISSATTATVNGLYVGKTYDFRVSGIGSGTQSTDRYEMTFTPSNDSNSALDDAFAEFFEEELFEV